MHLTLKCEEKCRTDRPTCSFCGSDSEQYSLLPVCDQTPNWNHTANKHHKNQQHVLVFFWGDHGSRGWYYNPQPALRPVFIAAQWATPCVWGVCMCVATVIVTVRVLCLWNLCAVYLYCPTLAASFSSWSHGLCFLPPTGTERTKPTCHPSKVIVGWCYGDPMQCTRPSIYLLSDSQHSLQLSCSYSFV